MNLIELQVQLRNVEKQISQLSEEIDKMKPAKQESKIDYDAITRVAKQYPIYELDICHAPEQLRKEFVSMLMYLFVADDNGLSERLLYLTRLSSGCKLKMNAKDVYQLALEIEMDDVERLSMELADYRYSFVIEAFVVANLTAEMEKDAWTLLADVVQLMKCDEEEIVVLSHVAKYKLTGDTKHLDSIPLPKTNRWSGKLKEYIPRKWVESKRRFNSEIFIGMPEADWVQVYFLNRIDSELAYADICKITHSLQNGMIAKVNDVIIEYEKACKGCTDTTRYMTNNRGTRIGEFTMIIQPDWKSQKALASCDGIFYSAEKKKLAKGFCTGDIYETYLEAYIVSIFDDYDSFKSWLDNR